MPHHAIFISLELTPTGWMKTWRGNRVCPSHALSLSHRHRYCMQIDDYVKKLEDWSFDFKEAVGGLAVEVNDKVRSLECERKVQEQLA